MCLWLLFYTDWFIHSLVLIWLTGFFSHVSSSPLTSIAHPSVLPTLLHIVINFLVFFSRRSRSDWQGHARRGFSSSRRARLCVWLGICVCVWVRPYLIHFIFPSFLMWTMKVMYHSLFCFGRNGDRWFHYEDPVNHLLPWCRTEMITACPQTQRENSPITIWTGLNVWQCQCKAETEKVKVRANLDIDCQAQQAPRRPVVTR